MAKSTHLALRKIGLRPLITAALGSALLLAPCWTDASAQDAAITLPSINVRTIVTSPTTVPTPVDEVATTVTVITAQEIETSQRRTMPDLLMTVPGLNVVQTGGAGGLDVGVHARHQLQPHQGADRRHRCQRSEQSEPRRSTSARC